jgi:hypothetical protein
MTECVLTCSSSDLKSLFVFQLQTHDLCTNKFGCTVAELDTHKGCLETSEMILSCQYHYHFKYLVFSVPYLSGSIPVLKFHKY